MANNETDTKQKAESDRLAKIAAENEEQRKLSEDAIKAATPKPTESEPESESTPKEAKTEPPISIFRQEADPEDHPLVKMMKEWLNQMIDMYDGNLEGAAWNQVKDIFKAVKNYLTDQDSPSEQQTNTSTPKPTPTPLTEEQIEAYKVLGLNQNKLVDPQVVNVATTLKIRELDIMMSACNDRIKELGDKQSADYDKLSKDNENQQPPMSREEYLEKHKAIHDQYLSDYNNVIGEFKSHASQRAECLKARDVLLQTPAPQANPSDNPSSEGYDNEKLARQTLNLSQEGRIEQQMVFDAINLKARELNSKVTDCNARAHALNQKYAYLDAALRNQQPPMSRELFEEKSNALSKQYANELEPLKREREGYDVQYSKCESARDTLLQTLAPQSNPNLTNNDSEQAPHMSNANDTMSRPEGPNQQNPIRNNSLYVNPEIDEQQGYDNPGLLNQIGNEYREESRIVDKENAARRSRLEQKWEANQKDPAYLKQRADRLGDFIAKDQAALDAMDKKYERNPYQTPQRERQELVARILDSKERLADVNRRLDTLQNEPTAVNKEQEGKQRDDVEITPLTDTSTTPPMDITEKEKDQSVVMTASTDASITPTMDNAEKRQDKGIVMTKSNDSSTTPGNNIPEKEFSNPQQNPQVTTAPDSTNNNETGHQPITPGM